MRDVTKKRLDRLLMVNRLKWIAGACTAALLSGGVFLFEDLDAREERVQAHGVIERVEPLQTNNRKVAAEAYSVSVGLDDGRKVTVVALKASHPEVGQGVDVVEHHHATGRVTYTWR